VPRYEYPEDPSYYSEPTRAARYAYDTAYDSPPGPPEPHRTPWYRSSVALVGAGALAVIVVAALVFAGFKLIHPSSTPTVTTSTPTSSTTATTAPSTPARQGHHNSSGGATVITRPQQTVTETDTATPTATATVTSTVPNTDTATVTAPSTETSTVTQTVTATPTRRSRGSGNRGCFAVAGVSQ